MFFEDPQDEAKDVSALYLIQQAMYEMFNSLVVTKIIAKEVCETLITKFSVRGSEFSQLAKS